VSEQDRFSGEPQPHVDAEEADALDSTGARLTRERPVLPAGLRAELRDAVGKLFPSPVGRPPTRLRPAIVAWLTSGIVLLAIAAFGLADLGPLAP
jgi:hypothetical protein